MSDLRRQQTYDHRLVQRKGDISSGPEKGADAACRATCRLRRRGTGG